jgi:hypothetical protein
MSYVSSAGKRLASLNGAFGVIDPQDVEIARGDLVSILYQAARNDVEYIFDDSISSLTDAADGVTVTSERSARLVGRAGHACRRRWLLPVAAVRPGEQPRPGRGLRPGQRAARRRRRPW